jgi:hypothetical protein
MQAESHFGFLNRVDSAYFAAVRDLMEEWFTRFPASGQKDLRARFRSGDRGQSVGAFWKLYLHELHARLGFELEREPEVPAEGRSGSDQTAVASGTSCPGEGLQHPVQMGGRRLHVSVVVLACP